MAVQQEQRLSARLAADYADLRYVAEGAIVVLIIANVVAVMLESVDNIGRAYAHGFYWFEAFSVAIFSLEYAFRFLRSGDGACDAADALHMRLRYVFSVQGLIDLAAIAPFYLGMFTNIDLRFLRVLRLARILKLTRYSPAMTLLVRALRREQQALMAAIFLLGIALVVAASGIYLCERGAQPLDFGSIPAAIWWAIATLTTVGYGDVTPITIGGKIFGAGVMIVGVGMVALPTGILASTFADELRRRREDFTAEVHNVLDDGVVTAEELRELEALSAETGLCSEEAARIFAVVRAQQARRERYCRHCGGALVEEARSRPSRS